jgi:hypothetical protein
MLRRSLASSEAWAQDVAAQPFAAILVVGGHAGSSLHELLTLCSTTVRLF